MKIRIISDLHIDVNHGFPFSLRSEEDKDVFALIPGDISGNVKGTANWIRQNVRRGMFVAGNHDPAYNDLGWTVMRQKKWLHEKFPLGGPVTFLDEQTEVMSKMIPDTNILVVGSTLYTDYKYADPTMRRKISNSESWKKTAKEVGLDDPVVAANLYMAERGLNDFRWGHVEDEFDDRGLKQRGLRAMDYLAWFGRTFARIQEIVSQNPDKDIILMSHHCPTPKCISSQYVGNDMNASYVSDLEPFIFSHPNIRAWCCGHVHSQTIMPIGENHQLIVCNPRGYERNFEADGWNPNTFLDTDTWTITTEPYENKRLKDAREKAKEDFMKYAPFMF